VTELDQHTSFIRTPQQLVVVILLSFLVPIIGIVMLVHLVTSQPSADPNAMTPESVASRIQPVGRLEFGAPPAAPGTRNGESIVKAVCSNCHAQGLANAPKIGDANAWAPHIKEGLPALVKNAINGIRAMPPRGGDATLTDIEVARAVVFMANQAGAKFKEPPAPKEAAKASSGGKPAAGDGKAVHDKVCFACHAQSVAGSPKLGDKEAWAPRIQQGMDTLQQSVTKGKGAMPPKAGNPALTDAELRAAVEFMVSQSK